MIPTALWRATAKKLRDNTTPHERILWRALKEFPVTGTHFRRQAPIGRYVVDFLCPAARLIIELDGGHHGEAAHATRDHVRQHWLEREGYRVIRFWNSEIDSELNAVLETIYAALYGSRDAEAVHLKHQRWVRRATFTPPRTVAMLRIAPSDPPPAGEGKQDE